MWLDRGRLYISLGLVVDLLKPGLSPTRFYDFGGRLFMSTGIVLGCVLGLRFTRESLDSQIAQAPHYLRIDSTPAFGLPSTTSLPTLTLTAQPTAQPTATVTFTPSPTATPLPMPARRMSIPAIGLNTSIKESGPRERWNGTYIWDPPAYAAGHYDSSGNPGEGRNIVFLGHNNMAGEVFRDLDKLSPGDEIILLTANGEFHYQVQQKLIIPYVGHEEEANPQILEMSAPHSSEMVTLISCWPYATFTNRIIIVALPVAGGGPGG